VNPSCRLTQAEAYEELCMYKDKILNLLRTSKTPFLSGEELARRTGISRTMVWKHIKSLELEGFGIEAVPSQGYRILSTPDILRRNDIRQGLKTKLIGREIVLLPEVLSTNTLAMEQAAQGAREGTAVIAEVQSGGRGRLGRTWLSPKGNLYLSVILRPQIPLHKAPMITLMGAVAVASAIMQACSLHPGIKWPNDILLADKKVSGLLTEMSAEQDRIRHIVLGIGIDVNMDQAALPPEVRILSTSLSAEAGHTINRTVLLQELLHSLDRWYQVFLADPTSVLKEWEKLNVTTGKRVMISGAGVSLTGAAQGIDDEGRLVIELDDGTERTVAAGDVTIVKE
jgi:BirA family transcriptional regulator, biotin operon repressor / biotin---[acetyl-CoA-carboxylase] ligase